MATTSTKNTKDFSVEINNFRTVNTKDNPVTMKDDELPILLNFMPIGQSLYTMPGYEETGATVPEGQSIIRMFDANINGTDYKIVATNNGSVFAFDTFWNRTTIAGQGIFSGNSQGPKFAQWLYTHLLIIDPKGYFSWDGTTLTHHTTMGAPDGGMSIAVWKGVAWIGGYSETRRTLFYSAPADEKDPADVSFQNFQTADGGGFVVIPNASLKNEIGALVGAQDYLYIIGDHAVNIISNISINSDGARLFDLTDAVPGIGTVFPDTVQVIGAEIIFLSALGLVSVTGSTYSILSEYLDGFFTYLDLSFSPVGFFAQIYNKLVYCMLCYVSSPLDGAKQKWFACYYESRWFFAYMGVVGGAAGPDFLFAGQSASSTDTTTFAAYDNKIVRLFYGTSTITKKLRTKYMNYGMTAYDKQLLRVGVTLASSLSFVEGFWAVVRAYASAVPGAANIYFQPQTITWYNQFGVEIEWDNSSNESIIWFGLQTDSLAMSEINGRGKRIALEYEESGANSYVLDGFIVDGQIGAGW